MDGFRIAMCQIFCLDADRSGNFARIENAVRDAAEKGADIVCFPETVVLGWVNPDAHRRAHAIPGEDTERLGELARQYGVHICAGLAEKDGQKLYDSAVLLDDRGKILLRHRKINTLAELMDPPYTRGVDVGVAETKFGAVGLLICADTFREDLLEKMAALRPRVVLVPYGWAAEEDKWPGHGKELEKVVINAAQKMKAAVVGTDLVGQISAGPWRGRVYGGQSVACDRNGKVLGKGVDRDRDITIVNLK